MKKIRQFVFFLLGILDCNKCGLLFIRFGKSVQENDGSFTYTCERCSNHGVMAEQVAKAMSQRDVDILVRKASHEVIAAKVSENISTSPQASEAISRALSGY